MISALPEKVWDFTQDWTKRRLWDDSVLEILEIKEKPLKIVRARFKGGLICESTYKLQDRPKMTTLVMQPSSKHWITGGGGSWQYQDHNGKTLWVQFNTIFLADNLILKLFSPIIRMGLLWSTKKAMNKAKRILETVAPLGN